MITRIFTTIALLHLLTSCASISQSINKKLADSISSGVKNSDNVEIVKNGLPAYILMIDGMIIQSPNNTDLLKSSASLNALYANQFSTDMVHTKRLIEKSFDYVKSSICIDYEICNLREMKFANFQNTVEDVNKKNIDSYYLLATTWTSWIKENSSDWNIVADLPRVELLLKRVIEISPKYDHGTPHIYLGVLNSILPPALGGKTDIAKNHFEKARSISENKNLIAQTLYAKHYARLLFDKELHDALLNEVIQTDPNHHELTLSNVLAQEMAKELLANSDDFF